MVNDSLWHEVSESEKDEIRQEIKGLLSSFASKLESSKLPKIPHHLEKPTREEGSGWNTDSDFRDIMLLNAPFVKDDFIIAEKGKWKKK